MFSFVCSSKEHTENHADGLTSGGPPIETGLSDRLRDAMALAGHREG